MWRSPAPTKPFFRLKPEATARIEIAIAWLPPSGGGVADVEVPRADEPFFRLKPEVTARIEIFNRVASAFRRKGGGRGFVEADLKVGLYTNTTGYFPVGSGLPNRAASIGTFGRMSFICIVTWLLVQVLVH